MSRDWRAPVTIKAIEENPDEIIVRADGTYRRSFAVSFDEADVGRIRAGYVCAKCFSPQPNGESFPEHCEVCRFPMRAQQAEKFARDFSGTKRIGPSTTYEEELKIAEEWVRARRLREQGLRSTDSGIIVPRGL